MVAIRIRPARPYPVFGGSIPSKRGGRRSLVLASIDQDGNYTTQVEDQGSEYGLEEPILFVPFGGIHYALTKDDLKEMIAGMRESHMRWRERQEPTPDFTARQQEWGEILQKRLSGRQHFYMKEGMAR